ncbi:MAG: hypothetical protein ABFD20_07470 [Anaerolineales bacterium]
MARLVTGLRENWLTVALLAAMALTYAVLHTPSSGLSEQALWAELDAADSAVIYFYSNT